MDMDALLARLTWIPRWWRAIARLVSGLSGSQASTTGPLVAALTDVSTSEQVAERLLASLMTESGAARGEIVLDAPASTGWIRVGKSGAVWKDPVALPLGTFERDLGVVRLDSPHPDRPEHLRELLWTGALYLELALSHEEAESSSTRQVEQHQAIENRKRMARTASDALADGMDETRASLVSLRQRLARLGPVERSHELENLQIKLAALEQTVLEHLESIRAGTGPLPPLSGRDRTRYDDHQEVS